MSKCIRVTIPSESEAKAREVLSFDKGIVCWSVSKTFDIIFHLHNLTQAELHLEVQELAISDAWDVNDMRDHFETYRRVMVRAEIAGCGKAMEARGHKVLFVCTTNKLGRNSLEHGP